MMVDISFVSFLEKARRGEYRAACLEIIDQIKLQTIDANQLIDMYNIITAPDEVEDKNNVPFDPTL